MRFNLIKIFIYLCLLLCSLAHSDELKSKSITVIGTTPQQELGESERSADDLQTDMVQTQQDLVRYNPEVSVAEVGRYGSKGFAMRGVDGNRVAISFDGVGIPDQQINQVFSAYGYMYEGRFAPDTELLSAVKIKVGADSFSAGGGAVGGAVNYQSKAVYDFIKGDKNYGGYAKTGYSSKNSEQLYSVGGAYSYNKYSALINYAFRRGHELKNHDNLSFAKRKLEPSYDFNKDADFMLQDGKYRSSKASLAPDPQTYNAHALLAKINYQANDSWQFGASGSMQKRINKANNFSKDTSYAKRISYDHSNMYSLAVNGKYEDLESEFLEFVKADLSLQKITGIANTYLYDDTTFELNGNKWRPQYDTTYQLKLNSSLLPWQSEAVGLHQLSGNFNFAITDHELVMKEWAKLTGPDLYGYQFIGPSVKKHNISLALVDDIEASDKLSGKFGLRYDYYNYKPYMSARNKLGLQSASDDYYAKDLYKRGDFDSDRSMDNLGLMAALQYKINPNWRLDYKLATGFLAPAVSQMYSAFEMLGNRLTTNVHLKPEQSLNNEVLLQASYPTFSVYSSVFHSKYKNFINTVYSEVMGEGCYWDKGVRVCTPMLRNYISADNIDSASIYGMRAGGAWLLGNYVALNKMLHGDLKLNFDMSFSKDKTGDGINLLAAEPLQMVFGSEYSNQDYNFTVFAKLRFLSAKKAADAKVFYFEFQGVDKPSKKVIKPYAHIDKSQDAWVFDLYGNKRFDSGIVISAGVYNLFNARYIPWSNLRSLAQINVNSMVDAEGVGLQRYTAPGRNFAAYINYEF